MVTGSSHSTSMCPPHSPTRTTKNSILKLAGAFHWPKTSRIRFWAFSYSIGEPCGRSDQVSMYFMDAFLLVELLKRLTNQGNRRPPRRAAPPVGVRVDRVVRRHVLNERYG